MARFLTVLTTFTLTLLFIPAVFAADEAPLPKEVTQAIEAAIATDNRFVIEATLKHAATQYPEKTNVILGYMPQAEEQPKEQEVAKVEAEKQEPAAETTPEAKTEEDTNTWAGTIEANYEKRSGNTQTQEFRGKLDLENDLDHWRNRFGLEGRYATNNSQTIKKDYNASYGLDYKLSEKVFVFGELDYVVDEFSGYDYRLTESIGAGRRKEWPEKHMSLDTRASIGARHYKQDAPGADTEHEILILKPEITYKWRVRDNVDFKQKLVAAFGQDISTGESETSLTYSFNDRLGIKFAFEAEYTSDVPAGTKKVDTFTSTGLVYKLFAD